MVSQIFTEFDTDGSGFIEMGEMENLMAKLAEMMGQPPPTEK